MTDIMEFDLSMSYSGAAVVAMPEIIEVARVPVFALSPTMLLYLEVFLESFVIPEDLVSFTPNCGLSLTGSNFYPSKLKLFSLAEERSNFGMKTSLLFKELIILFRY